jgi:hypothetical protein
MVSTLSSLALLDGETGFPEFCIKKIFEFLQVGKFMPINFS